MHNVTELLEASWQERDAIAALDTRSFAVSHPHHARLARALSNKVNAPIMGAADLAVLLRSVILEAAIHNSRRGVWIPIAWMDRLTSSLLERHGLQELRRKGDATCISAIPWSPHWLNDHPSGNACSDVDLPLYDRRPARNDPVAEADPVLLRLGYDHYQSEAQREAVRTALSAPAGATVVINLPTGCGKSVCALLPSFLTLPNDIDHFGVTPIVVPTVSLALDLERRIQEQKLIPHKCAYRPGTEDADAILVRIRYGLQGPVFLSPESLIGAAKADILEAAERGFLRYFVVDEAHMIATWGDEFRPAFQQIAALRRELLAVCNPKFITLLMSATFTPHALETLTELFAQPAGIHFVHAVRLRPEPRYYWQKAKDRDEQMSWIEDALTHLPRPTILYTTRRRDAIDWHSRLQQMGYNRIGLIHGASTESQRLGALENWRNNQIDLMVATSAFGLGVDKGDVRSVVHATFPESVDRYYQDVGRGGRDGCASIALMVWTSQDEQIADNLAQPTFIGIERGLVRWASMFQAHARQSLGNGIFAVPTDVSPSAKPEDVDMQNETNERWNYRTLLLMQRAGVIEIQGESSTQDADRFRRFAHVQPLEHDHLDESIWTEHIDLRRTALLQAYHREWQLMQGITRASQCIAHVFQNAYQYHAPSMNVDVVRACGSCPFCRGAGDSSTVGRLYARHAPTEVWPVERCLGPNLLRLLQGNDYAFIFVGARDAAYPAKLDPLVDWLINEGIHDFLLDYDLRVLWRPTLSASALPPVFFHHDTITGIRKSRPAAVFVLQNSPRDWERIERSLVNATPGSIFLIHEDARTPARPDRLLRDVIQGAARWSFDRWEEMFLE